MILGEPTLQVSPKCKIARKAMSGGYCYGRIQVSGEERYHEEPMNNRYRVMGEAAEFMMIGGGEDANVFRAAPSKKLNYIPIGVI